MIPVKARFLWVKGKKLKHFDCHEQAAAWQVLHGGSIYIWVWGEDDE